MHLETELGEDEADLFLGHFDHVFCQVTVYNKTDVDFGHWID